MEMQNEEIFAVFEGIFADAADVVLKEIKKL